MILRHVPRLTVQRSVERFVVVLMALAATAETAGAACPLPPPGSQPATGVPGNRVSNPGAEDATSVPWSAPGGASTPAYGSSASGPSPAYAVARNFGERYFAVASPEGGVLTQEIVAPDLAGKVIVFGATTVRRDAGDAGHVRVQALDAYGAVLGEHVASPLTPTPSSEGAVVSQAFAGRALLSPAAHAIRIEVRTAGGVDAAFITDAEYGAVPTLLCAPDGPAPVPPHTAPPPAPAPPPASIRVTSVARTVAAGRQLRVRVRHAKKGDVLDGRWTRAGRGSAQRAPIRAGRASFRAPRRAGTYRLRLRSAEATVLISSVRVTRRRR